MKHKLRKKHEIYPLERSPFAQKMTQKKLAELLAETKDNLQKFASENYKEQFIVRRKTESGGKERDLAYPTGKLRSVHEKLKFQFSKIILPAYLMSPRKGKTTKLNASIHLGNIQYFTIDITKFYPSTTQHMIKRSLINQFGMYEDVAGLIARISTVGGVASFGSPLTPVLAAIVHKPMFDRIKTLCDEHDLSCSLWVDDLCVSGKEIRGDFIDEVREIIASYGLKSHKVKIYNSGRTVVITGVGILGYDFVLGKAVEMKTKQLFSEFKAARLEAEIEITSSALLSRLGSSLYVVGKSTKRGQRISWQINSVRQTRNSRLKKLEAITSQNIDQTQSDSGITEYADIPF